MITKENSKPADSINTEVLYYKKTYNMQCFQRIVDLIQAMIFNSIMIQK